MIEADNPLDIGPAGYSDASIFATTTATMLAHDGIGAVLLALTGGGPWQQRAKAEAVAPVARDAAKPVVLSILGDESPLDSGALDIARESATPFYARPSARCAPSPRCKCALTLTHASAHARRLTTPRRRRAAACWRSMRAKRSCAS
ncbi:MAG: hypothetical protein NVV62_13465 [Terricaulis sp.]|nr:hypothetical protein [Terricaulis sp.]